MCSVGVCMFCLLQVYISIFHGKQQVVGTRKLENPEHLKIQINVMRQVAEKFATGKVDGQLLSKMRDSMLEEAGVGKGCFFVKKKPAAAPAVLVAAHVKTHAHFKYCFDSVTLPF